jgi:DNA primase
MQDQNWVDFRAVKAAVSMRMALDHFGVNWLRKNGDELRGRCPIHKGEGQNTFHVNVIKNAFNCFSCKARGNVLDFVAAMENCSVRDAAVKLKAWFAIPAPEQGTVKSRPKTPGTKAVKDNRVGETVAANKPLGFALKGTEPSHPYLQNRGISKQTAEEFGIGYFAGRGSMHGRIVIPIHDEHGMLLAYAGRAVDDSEPKYKLPAGFHKSLVVYNLHRATAGAATPSTVVLVEGFFDCIRVQEAGYPAAALMGSSLSTVQEELLCGHFNAAVILLDGDETGRKGTEECLLRLGRRIWTKAVCLPDGKQPDQLSGEELRQLLGQTKSTP